MLFARGEHGERLEATPGGRGRCPQCDGEVLAKCGKLVSWHWAHRTRECDHWSEGETEWHLAWKRLVEPDACEVVMGDHRADICTRSGLVVELQHSPIDVGKITEREAFYPNMVWLFDAKAYALALYPRAAWVDFDWVHPRRALAAVEKPMYWDLGFGFVLRVEALKLDANTGGFRGSGILLDAACFASAVFGASARSELHVAARSRAGRVVECGRLAQSILRSAPSLGIDDAMKKALERCSAPIWRNDSSGAGESPNSGTGD